MIITPAVHLRLLPLVLVAVSWTRPPAVGAQEPRCDGSNASKLAAYAGSYGEGGPVSDAVVTFMERSGTLVMHPALWSGPMVLGRVAADSFVVATHPRFGATFVREGPGCVVAARIRGLSPEGRYERLDEEERRPVQLLVEGRPREAARRYAGADPSDVERFVAVGRSFLRSNPTRRSEAVGYFSELGRLLPGEPAVLAALGDALVFAGERGRAVRAYGDALSLDPANETATTALERLHVLPGSEKEEDRLPFSLEALFAPPAPEEIDTVWARWKRRDLDPHDVTLVTTCEVDLHGAPAEARVVAHRVHGERHLGVVLVPEGAEPGSLPVLVEAKGVSPGFFPLHVPEGLTSPHLLGAERDQVIYVAPGYRGERVILGPDTLTSEGRPNDAWDGATDDLIGLLRVALEITPEADSSRVCVFGRSRGGAVALMSGMREQRVDCVVAWAAPTDWFRLMGLDGWTQRELVEDGLRNDAVPGETGGQFIDYFLASSLRGRRGLRETRLHLVASSPLYFAERLPLAQVHWGMDDTIVPMANGTYFVERYRHRVRGWEDCLSVRLHPDAGHDQDRQFAPMQSRAFLLAAFDMDDGRIAGCRPSGASSEAG